MPTYPFFKKIIRSLVPSDFYIHILSERMYKAFLYMALYILILTTCVSVYQGIRVTSAMNNIVEDYNQGLIPPFKISGDGLWVEGDGIVTIDYLDIPIIMHDEDVIDVNDVMHYESAIFFEKERIVFISPNFETFVTDYTSVAELLNIFLIDEFNSELQFNESIPFGLIAILTTPIVIGTLFFITSTSFLYNSFFVLLIANILRAILGIELRFRQLYHMVIYAMTFSVFWTNFSLILPRSIPGFLNTIVHFVLPTIILLNVLMIIRKKAMDEMDE